MAKLQGRIMHSLVLSYKQLSEATPSMSAPKQAKIVKIENVDNFFNFYMFLFIFGTNVKNNNII